MLLERKSKGWDDSIKVEDAIEVEVQVGRLMRSIMDLMG